MRVLSALKVFSCAFAVAAASVASAQGYPDKPINVVVPYAPGGGYDRIARMVGPYLSDRLGQPLIVINRGGAGGTIGMASVAKAPADGYTLVVAGLGDLAIVPALNTKLPYDVKRDFAPITMLARFTLLLGVNPKLPVKTVGELITLAKANPGKYTFAVSSVGSTGHLSMELIKSMAGIDLLSVPYKGTGPAITDLAGGQVDLMFAEFGSLLPLVKGDRVKALAVSTPERSSDLPNVPTVNESGLPGFEVTGWWGLFAPAGTPTAIINRLNTEITSIMQLPEMRDSLAKASADPGGIPLDRFNAQITADVAKFQRAVKASGIQLN